MSSFYTAKILSCGIQDIWNLKKSETSGMMVSNQLVSIYRAYGRDVWSWSLELGSLISFVVNLHLLHYGIWKEVIGLMMLVFSS